MRSRRQPRSDSRREAPGAAAAQQRHAAAALHGGLRATAATSAPRRLRLLSLGRAALLPALKDTAAQADYQG